jgi:hypothetical protein
MSKQDAPKLQRVGGTLNKMTVSVTIATIALFISVVTFLINLWLGHRVAVRGRKPVLVFVYQYRPGRGPAPTWHLQNIGKGPALNVLVAMRVPKYQAWYKPVRVPPLAEDADFECHWLEPYDPQEDFGLGVEYTDSEGRWYTATTGNDNAVVLEGRWLPRWKPDEISPHWRTPTIVESHPQKSAFPAGVLPAEYGRGLRTLARR